MRLWKWSVIGALVALAGCATAPQMGKDLSAGEQELMQNAPQSMAAAMVSLAGYPGLVPDNTYSTTLDAAVNGGTMAMLLPKDVPSMSSLGAGLLGFSLTALQGTYPFDNNFTSLVFVPVEEATDMQTGDFAYRVINKYYQKLPLGKGATDKQKAKWEAFEVSKAKCEAVSGGLGLAGVTYSHKCKYSSGSPSAIQVGSAYDGAMFDKVMPSMAGKKYVVVLVRGGNIEPKPSTDNVFEYINHTLTSRYAVLPFVKPNSEGKRLVFIEGKATLL